MIHVKVCPGNCNLESELVFEVVEGKKIAVSGTSKCPNVQNMIDQLSPLDGLREPFLSYRESVVFNTADKYLAHKSCPVPLAILKGLEISCGLALPQDVSIKFQK